ncbi:MAG: hypothetical protein IJI52_03710, partial [Solobacterium sp.]|nr:hypothetical protein [Solobacterium sp.]
FFLWKGTPDNNPGIYFVHPSAAMMGISKKEAVFSLRNDFSFLNCYSPVFFWFQRASAERVTDSRRKLKSRYRIHE